MTVAAGQVYVAPHAPRFTVDEVVDGSVRFHAGNSPRVESVTLDVFERWIARTGATLAPQTETTGG